MFHIGEIKLFCFVVAMCDIGHDVETIHSIYILTAKIAVS